MPIHSAIVRTGALLITMLTVVTALDAGAIESRNPGEPLAFRLDSSAELRDLIKNLPAIEETSPAFGFNTEEWLEASSERMLFRAEADFDDDGIPELILHIEHPAHCGTSGCATIILKRDPPGWRLIATFNAHRRIFALLQETDLGWHRFFNGEEIYLRIECGYTTQEDIDDEASRGHGPCDAY